MIKYGLKLKSTPTVRPRLGVGTKNKLHHEIRLKKITWSHELYRKRTHLLTLYDILYILSVRKERRAVWLPYLYLRANITKSASSADIGDTVEPVQLT